MAWVTSMTMATSGSSRAADERAPPPVAAISSRVVATAVTEARGRLARPAAAAPRAPRRPRCGCRCSGSPAGRWETRARPAASTPGSPIRTRASASARLRAPTSIQRSSTLETFSRSSFSMRWMARLPTTPVTGPCAAQQDHPLSHEDLVVPAADGVEAEVALLIDVGHHHADLIDVAGQHEPGRGRPR